MYVWMTVKASLDKNSQRHFILKASMFRITLSWNFIRTTLLLITYRQHQ